MITFLSSPKDFQGVSKKNQINAIQSWLCIDPDVEVILYGEASGCKEVCAELGIKHVPDIECSSSGVPYFNAIVTHAKKQALYDIQVYLNCDILLTQSILDAISLVNFPKYLIVGQRIDLGEKTKVTFHKDNWQLFVEKLIRRNGVTLHAPSGMDYFIFTRGLWEGLQPLVIGRGGYDSALVAFCLRMNIPIIDASYVIRAIHQYHDFAHVKGNLQEVTSGLDARNNRRIHNIEHSAPNIIDSTWLIKCGHIIPNKARGDLIRYFESFLRYKKRSLYLSYAVRAIWRLLTSLRIYKAPKVGLSNILQHL